MILCLNGGLTFLRINSVGGDGDGGGGGVPSSDDVITNGALFQPGGPLPNPPPQTVLDARSKRWEDELDDYCRFPSFVNNDQTYFKIRKGTHMMEYSDDLRKGHFRSVLSDTRVKNAKRLERTRNLHNTTGRKSISFLHLGKAGGSSLVCNIMPKHSAHCEGKKRTLVPSAISKMTNCYVHYDNDMHCYDNPTLAINIRNPIDRMASWYHYEHLDNLEELWGDSIRTCGQHMLFKCYNSFHDLAEYGLAGTRPPPTQLLRIEYNASEEICRHWAWSSVQGTASASHHNVWNYDWCVRRLRHSVDAPCGGIVCSHYTIFITQYRNIPHSRLFSFAKSQVRESSSSLSERNHCIPYRAFRRRLAENRSNAWWSGRSSREHAFE